MLFEQALKNSIERYNTAEKHLLKVLSEEAFLRSVFLTFVFLCPWIEGN